MSEWWTYSPHDFVMYTARAYYRLFALHNARLWPAQPLMLGAGIAIVAWDYFVLDYSSIHTFARAFAGLFALEAVLLGAAAAPNTAIRAGGGKRAIIGWGVILFALLIQPLLGPALGRPWSQIEIFGIAPDPTMVMVFGVLLVLSRSAWWLWVVPVLWIAYNGATLQLLGAQAAWLLPAIAVAALVARIAVHGERPRPASGA